MEGTDFHAMQSLIDISDIATASDVAYMEGLGLEPELIKMNLIIKACAKMGDTRRAFELLNRMERMGRVPQLNTVNLVIKACAKAADASMAFEVLNRMEAMGIHPDVITMGTVINACARAADATKALEVLNRMEWLGLKPNDSNMRNVIDACARGSDASKASRDALEALTRMEKMGLVPDLGAMNSVIDAFARVGDSSRTLEVLDKMERIGMRPNRITMTSLITACAPVGDASKAVQALSRLGMHLDQGIMTYVLKSICRAGRSFQEQDDFISTIMRKQGFVPDGLAYREMLLCCCGQATPLTSRCTEVFDALLADRVDPVEFNLLGVLREAIGNTEFGKYCTSRTQQFERIANPAKHAAAKHATSNRASETTSNAYGRMQTLLRSHPGDAHGHHGDDRHRREGRGGNRREQIDRRHSDSDRRCGPRSDWDGNHREQSRKRPRSRSRERQEANQGPQDLQSCQQFEKVQTKKEVGAV